MRFREIERLRLRVKYLEEQLDARDPPTSNNIPVDEPRPGFPETSDPLRGLERKWKHWEGIYTSIAHSDKKQYYGPSSSFYFISRMSSFLCMAFQQPRLNDPIQSASVNRSFISPITPNKGNLNGISAPVDGPVRAESLTGTQEDYFLGLFWQSYHCILQIVDEVDFREHYRSLWTTPGTSRKTSALVDIVLALCMQHAVAITRRSGITDSPHITIGGTDAFIAGLWLYRRSQALLSAELESPSMMTVQCHVLSVYYLCNASFQNMAHSTLALGVRTAQTIGLHLEPTEDIPRKERELRKRLWWTLCTIEIKTCMKLGRPWSTQLSEATCTLPEDDYELALVSGSNLASYEENITWLTYNLQNTKLVLAARTIYILFYDNCADILGGIDGKSLYSDPHALDTCAQFLMSSMNHLQTWLSELPKSLKTKRKDSGASFSTDRTRLDLELFAPLWLQRQRLLLELLYHNLAMNLYRPFIAFSPAINSSSLGVEANASSCMNHAIAITDIMHQIFTETDLLRGWHEASQWQWNATISLIGFILAKPLGPSAALAREAINSAIEVFEAFGNNFAVAANAANVTPDLTAKADCLIHRHAHPSQEIEASQIFNSPNSTEAITDSGRILSQSDNKTSAVNWNVAADPFDLAFAVDSFNTSNPILDGNGDISGMWDFPSD